MGRTQISVQRSSTSSTSWSVGSWLVFSLILVLQGGSNMKILQVNCSGFTKELNIQLARYVEDKKVEVVCLQETFAKDSKTIFKNWHPYLKPSPDGYGGVAIFVCPTLKSAPCTSLSDANLEAVFTQIQVAGKVITLGSVYIRPGHLDKIDILRNKIASIKTPLIVMGDLNGHSKLWDNGYNSVKKDTARKMGLKIEHLIVQENLSLKNNGQYTFVHRKDRSKWALDLTLTRNLSVDTRWHSDHFSSLCTDHCPTLLHMDDSSRSFRKEKWDIKNAPWDVWAESLDRASSGLMDNEVFQAKSPMDKCNILQELIKDNADLIIPKKTVCEHSRAFVSEQISKLHKEFRQAKKRFKIRSDEQNQIALDIARDKLNDEYVKERDKFWKELCHKTSSSDLWNTVNKITNRQKHVMIQPLRNPDGTYEFDDRAIAQRLKVAHVTKGNIDTSSFDTNWYNEVNGKVDQIIQKELEYIAGNKAMGINPREPYNRDISNADVYRVIDKLKANSSPGPDGILPIMLKKGKDALTPIMTNVLQSCWEAGEVPDQWKEDNRVFIPKANDDPHTEKSLRGLSLNPIIGKCMERIKANDLICWLEANFKIPDEHYAYRKSRGVVQALLALICNIRRGFVDNECTVTAMIDLHAAFDTIWRKGLIFRLHDMGIRGRLLLYVNSFLSNRKSRLLVNSHESWTTTNIGVPQGSIIAPILFVCYVSEITSTIPCCIGFADDLTAWVTHASPDIASKTLESQLAKLNDWTKRWRLVVNKTKTEIICFTKSSSIQVTVTLDGTPLKQVKDKKVLGVTTDENLTFRSHVDNIRAKALKSLCSVGRLLDETGGIRTELGLQLYNSLVLPVLTYAYPVWSTVTNTQVSMLEDVHEAALRKLTGAHGGSPTNALEVILGVLPFRLQLQCILGKEYLRILRKPQTVSIRKIVSESASCRSNVNNPAKQMRVALRETGRTINLDQLDPEPKFSVDTLTIDISKCHIDNWQQLGSSHDRTASQKAQATKSVQDHLRSLPASTLPIFTDGSALGNPGPCGSAAVIFLNGIRNDPIAINQPVHKRSTSFHGEVFAIHLALNYVDSITNPKFDRVIIHTDCQAAMESILNNRGVHTKLCAQILDTTKKLNAKDIKVELCWIPGHAGISANELADIEAKKAADTASKWSDNMGDTCVTLKDAKRVLQKQLLTIWQRQWDTQSDGRFTYSLLPIVKLRSINKSHGKVLRGAEVRLNRLQTGHTMLRAHHLSQSLDRRLGNPINTMCDCLQGPQDTKHLLLECPLLKCERDVLTNNVAEAILKHSDCNVNKLSLELLLGDIPGVPHEAKVAVRREVIKFLAATATQVNI